MSEALVRQPEVEALMPVMSIETATDRYRTIVEYVGKLMHEGSDFGKIPGTEKNTLLKPGAEKLCTLFGLSKRFTLVDSTEDWRGDQMGEPFFNYLYRCGLYRGDQLIAEADGSCNSRETKYRWRQGERVCPECGKGSIIKGREEYGGGWICFAKKGGCGAKFADADERIKSQQIGRVANPDIADQVNTIQKMAQKRALIAATLLAVNASEFFTQDMEDFLDTHPVTAGDKHEAKAEPRSGRRQPTVSKVRKVLVQSVADAFRLLNDAGDSPKWTPALANEFVAQHFEGAAGVDQLDDGQINDLLKMLSERRDGLKKESSKERDDIIASIKVNFDTDKHLETYLTERKFPSLDQCTLEQLKTIDTDVSVPF